MYGVKRGLKAPGEFGFGDIMGLGLAGAAGIIAALVTDYQQQGEASALFTINQWVVQLGSILGFTDIPLWMVVVGMTAIGAGSIFYFQPITRQGAFAQGFGLLAVLMTATPGDLAGGLEAINDNLPGLDSSLSREAALTTPQGGAQIFTAAYRPGDAKVIQVQRSAAEAAKYDLHLEIVFPEGLSSDFDTLIRTGAMRGRLHNENTNETWNLFRSAGGTIRQEGNSLIIHAGVPAREATAQLWVRIECAGYEIEVQSATARLNSSVDWEIVMTPSSTPLFFQRLRKSYWF